MFMLDMQQLVKFSKFDDLGPVSKLETCKLCVTLISLCWYCFGWQSIFVFPPASLVGVVFVISVSLSI